MLCPGFINTNIADAARNFPDRYSGGERPALSAEATIGLDSLRQILAEGISPLYVGELVREGIEGDWPYIFTDAQFEPMIEARFAAIKEGFDRIRGRTPARG